MRDVRGDVRGAHRPATGFGASRHESQSGFGGAERDGHDGFGASDSGPGSGPASFVLQKAQKARELAAQRRKERVMTSGVVRNDVETNDGGGFGLGGGSNPGAGFGGSFASGGGPAPPSRPMAPGGFQRPRPPSQPRPTSVSGYAYENNKGRDKQEGTVAVRANPLFASSAPRRVEPLSPPGVSGRGDSGHGGFASPSPSASRYDETSHVSRDLDRVVPFDESGIETLTLESPGSPKRRGGVSAAGALNGFRDGPGPTHVVTGGPRSQSHRTPRPAVVEISDRRVFLSQPAPFSGDPVQCHILRRYGKGGVLGIGGKRYPEYFLYLDGPGTTPGVPTDGAVFLLSARRRKKSTSSNYVISLDEEDLNRQSGNFFGKLRSNFVGTEFTIFDKGAKPGAVELSKDPADAEARFSSDNKRPAGVLPPRTELGAVRYEYNVLGTKGPRVMTGAIPRVDEASGRRAIFRPTDSHGKGGILEALKRKPTPDVDDLVVLRNKQPKWNEQMQAYCLNFNGRVTEASVKNFQLADSRDETEATILQFGKVGKHAFTMDYAYPMSALQAFAICLSSFDNKLACE
jgi:tubby-related protein 1